MNIIKTLVAATAAVTLVATSATAGGFAPAVEDAGEVIVVEPTETAAGSLPGWVIPVVIAAILIAIATSNSSEEDADEA